MVLMLTKVCPNSAIVCFDIVVDMSILSLASTGRELTVNTVSIKLLPVSSFFIPVGNTNSVNYTAMPSPSITSRGHCKGRHASSLRGVGGGSGGALRAEFRRTSKPSTVVAAIVVVAVVVVDSSGSRSSRRAAAGGWRRTKVTMVVETASESRSPSCDRSMSSE